MHYIGSLENVGLVRNSPLSIRTSPAKFLAGTCAQVPLAGYSGVHKFMQY